MSVSVSHVSHVMSVISGAKVNPMGSTIFHPLPLFSSDSMLFPLLLESNGRKLWAGSCGLEDVAGSGGWKLWLVAVAVAESYACKLCLSKIIAVGALAHLWAVMPLRTELKDM